VAKKIRSVTAIQLYRKAALIFEIATLLCLEVNLLCRVEVLLPQWGSAARSGDTLLWRKDILFFHIATLHWRKTIFVLQTAMWLWRKGKTRYRPAPSALAGLDFHQLDAFEGFHCIFRAM